MLVDTSPAIVPAMRWSPTGAEALAEAIVHASLPPPLRALIEAKHSIGGSAYSREAFRGCDRRWAPSWRSFGLELGRLASIRIHNSLYLVSLPTPGLPNCTLTQPHSSYTSPSMFCARVGLVALGFFRARVK